MAKTDAFDLERAIRPRVTTGGDVPGRRGEKTSLIDFGHAFTDKPAFFHKRDKPINLGTTL